MIDKASAPYWAVYEKATGALQEVMLPHELGSEATALVRGLAWEPLQRLPDDGDVWDVGTHKFVRRDGAPELPVPVAREMAPAAVVETVDMERLNGVADQLSGAIARLDGQRQYLVAATSEALEIVPRLLQVVDELQEQLELAKTVQALDDSIAGLKAQKACCRGCVSCAGRRTWAVLTRPITWRRRV